MVSNSKGDKNKVVLYRKWRPQTFSEMIGQNHVKKTLVNAIIASRISHAYIFCGPRGTGKTSAARLLAKAVNCSKNKGGEPCNECKICREITEGKCLDLIEIDGASNRGIDEIRDLREKIQFSPSSALYKVFIIDEVHMLTREAFNALLKTLEEPPAHAIFVLVTTEVHKVPPTVLSRCQRFDFERINIEDLINRLYFIAQKENLNIHKEALRLIACNAQGGLRDAISLLDQLVSYGGKSVTLGQIRSVLGLADIKSLEKLTDLLIKKDSEKSIKLVNEIFSRGYDLHQFTKGMIEYLRSILIIKLSADKKLLQFSPEQINKIIAQSKEINLSKVLNLIKLFVKAEKDLKIATFPQLPLELALVEANQEEEIEKEIVSKEIKKESKEINKPSAALATNNRLKSTENNLRLKDILDFWEQILEEVKFYNHSVCAFLKASRPIVVKKDKITLEFFYPFHKERIEDQKNLHLVEEAIHKVTERSYKVHCVLGERRDIAKTNKEDKESNNLLQSAQEIFKDQAE